MNEAVRPNFFSNVPVLEERNESEKLTDEERSLHAMSQTGGWAIFERMARQAMQELGNINKVAISNGLPLEEIGRNAIVVNLAQDTIERLLNKVLDAKEACERGN